MDNTQKTRCEYIDAVKGVGILCITLLHFEDGIFPTWLNIWISLFMISTFYFTSGWISSLKSGIPTPKEIFSKRLRQLGIPYLWFSLMILGFEAIWLLLGFTDGKIILRDIYKTVTLRGIGTLWFLPVLLFGESLFVFIRTRRHPLFSATTLMIVVLCVFYLYYFKWIPLRNSSELYRIIDSPMRPVAASLCAWPVIEVGYLAGKHLHRFLEVFQKRWIFISGVLLIVFSLWLVLAPPVNIFYINTLLGNTVPVYGFICLFAVFPHNFITRFFSYWGRNSLILMCTHFSITEEIMKIFNRLVLNDKIFNGPVTMIYFVIAIFLTWLMIPLFNGKLRFMLGK